MPDLPSRYPRATYRVQLHAGFTFDDAVEILPYLSELGISHLYVSPILQAAPESTHGYDVLDHGRISDELGGEAAFERLTDALRRLGMGLVVDVVPNHMSIAHEENRWWWDVLMHGPASRYARFFDVDWDPPESRLHNVILLPVLPDHYGRVLEAGEIQLERRAGAVVCRHAERAFPLDPRTLARLVTDAAECAGSDELGFIGGALAELPPSTTPDPELVARRQRDAEVLSSRLDALAAEDRIGSALDAVVAAVNRDPDAVDALLDAQNYRLALWRASLRDLGYRRFFDIDELIGLRMEDPIVFAETHRRILEWVGEGRVDGLRIDHPDGLRDPAGYFARLREAAPGAWIVAEKILQPDEPLPADWPIDGTTGYGFANRATTLLVDRSAESAFDELWASVAEVGPAWEDIVREARQSVLTDLLGSDLNRLTDLWLTVCDRNRRYRDVTRHELHEALREVAAALPVYRTYVRAADRHVDPRDHARIDEAVALATDRRPDLDADLFAFLGRILRLEEPDELSAELAMRFQQLTPAAMAKGSEDTAFYRYHRLVALNEVGGEPGTFGIEPADFHAALAHGAETWPQAMLALSTHDTKRSADVRARLAILSEDPDGWREDVQALMAALGPHRSPDGGPTDADLLLLIQTVVGAWPIEPDRVLDYLRKASREAKLHTSWTDPNEAYDRALDELVPAALADAEFVARVERLAESLRDDGWAAALSQAAWQLAAPGVPDTYQGTELWSLTLVDPDNRSAVDYDLRRRLLADAASASAAEAWARRDEGLVKLWVIARGLDLRRRRPEPFRTGDYRPLSASGSLAQAVVAFSRGGEVVVVAPRLVRRVRRAGWEDTTVVLPDGRWRDLDRREHAGTVRLAALLADLPVALLERLP